MATHTSRDRTRVSGAVWAAAALLGALLLGACSTNVGELSYPAVHDMPPARPGTTLSDAEQQQAEKDLITARDGVEARAQQNAQGSAQAGGQPADTTASTASTGSKSAAAGKGAGQQTGGNRSP